MDNELIIRYINKTASQDEVKRVLEWASKSKENETILIEMINGWVAEHMPHNEADDAKYEEFKLYLNGYNSSIAATHKSNMLNKIAWGAVAAIMLLLLGWNIFLREKIEDITPATSVAVAANPLQPANHTRIMYTNKGVKAQIILPDSSFVWLNSDTKIEYPEVFDKNIREVKLSGEAYFEVKSDPMRPMVITTGKGFKVKVTGTTFNIKAYDNDNIASTTLYSGSISLLYKDTDNKLMEKVILPNQSIEISEETISTPRNVTVEQMENTAIWKEGKIHFESTPIREAIKILNRWHGTQFTTTNPEILDYQITANFENESIVQIMELIKMTTYINYSISGKNITLSKR